MQHALATDKLLDHEQCMTEELIRSDPPQQPLAFKDAMELALMAGKNVDGHWTRFYTFLFALLAWLLSNPGKLGQNDAIILSLGVGSFFALNLIALVRAYIIVDLAMAEAMEIAKTQVFLSEEANRYVRSKMLQMRMPLRVPVAVLSHLVGAVTLIYLSR